jgi:hypothetical protein
VEGGQGWELHDELELAGGNGGLFRRACRKGPGCPFHRLGEGRRNELGSSRCLKGKGKGRSSGGGVRQRLSRPAVLVARDWGQAVCRVSSVNWGGVDSRIVMRTSLLCIQRKDRSLEHVRDSWISRYILTLSIVFQNLHLVPCMCY